MPPKGLRKSKKTSEIPAEEHIVEKLKSPAHPKSLKDTSRREKEVRVVGAISKELSQKPFQNELNKMEATLGCATKKEIFCRADKVSINFSSPLQGITAAYYIKKWKSEDLVAQDKTFNEGLKDKKSVIAVKLNWKKGVKIQQHSKYSRRTQMVEPELTKTDFDFETKMKFMKELAEVREKIFFKRNIKLLDGNESRGSTVLESKSVITNGQEPATDENTSSNPNSFRIFEDKEEHEVLVIPMYSKTGFDCDLTKRYTFPYCAKFLIEGKSLEHHFQLNVPLSDKIQHYGLIFYFPDGNETLCVKSLLTVYSVCPSSAKYACLTTYTPTPESDSSTGSSKAKQCSPRTRNSAAKPFVRNLTTSVSANLSEEKIISSSFGSSHSTIECNISHPRQRVLGISKVKLPSADVENDKHKMKTRLIQSIQRDALEVQ